MIDTVEMPVSLTRHTARFVAVVQNSLRGVDQLLGYGGRDRFVMLYYEPRGEEVIWRDSRSYGFATGAGPTFIDGVAPVAELYDVEVGSNGKPAKQVLLVDRKEQRAYFADKGEALRFLAEAAACASGKPCESGPWPASTYREITHEAMLKLAHEIWESKGRPQGQELQDWLEAESRLRRA